MAGNRNPLGLALGNMFYPQDDAIGGTGGMGMAAQMQPAQPQREKLGKGELIAGILADALAGAVGRPGMFAAQQQQRQQEDREAHRLQAQWGLQRRAGLEDYEARQQIEQRYKAPDVSPMVRDAQAWAGMTPEQRAAFAEMNKAKEGDPIVNTTLPNGQFYSGPRSGLAQALMGGPAPAAPSAPPRPVGKLTPITGGPTPQASGTFRP